MSMMGGPRRRPGPKDTGPKAKFNQLIPYMKEQKGLLSIAIFFSLIGAGVNLAQPLVVGQIISTVQKGEDVLTLSFPPEANSQPDCYDYRSKNMTFEEPVI